MKKHPNRRNVYLAVLLISVIIVMSGYGNGLQMLYDLQGNSNFIKRSDLREKVLPGETAGVSSLINLRAGTICVLGPYASQVA